MNKGMKKEETNPKQLAGRAKSNHNNKCKQNEHCN